MIAGCGTRGAGYPIVVAVVFVACGRGGDSDRREVEPAAWKDGNRPSSKVGELPTVAPIWQVRLPREPGVPVMRSVAGPTIGHGVAVFGATGVGWAGVDLTGGEVLWHLPGESRPGRVAIADHGNVELRGECAHIASEVAGDCSLLVEARTGEVIRTSFGPSEESKPEPTRAVSIEDEALHGPDWEAEDRYHAILGEKPDTVVAIRLTGGIGPAEVSTRDGSIRVAGDSIPALHVLSHVAVPGGGLAIAVRVDSTLFNDAVAYFDRDHRLVWAWSLPRPQSARVDDVGIAATDRGVVVFYDGRFVTNLGVENSNTVNP